TDVAGVVIAAFETEISVADWLVAKFSPIPIPTAATPAIRHMTACRIEASLPRANQITGTLEGGIETGGVNYVTLRCSKKIHLHRVPRRFALGPATPPSRSACYRTAMVWGMFS